MRRDAASTSFDPGERVTAWMSHGDHVDVPPDGYEVTAKSTTVPIAAPATPTAMARKIRIGRYSRSNDSKGLPDL